MQVTAVTNLVYADAGKTAVDCLVTFDNGTPLPFTVTENDSTNYCEALWIDLKAGQFGPIAPYVAPTPTPQQAAMAAIAAGINLTSTGTPALNGAYAVDANAQAQMNGVITYTMLNNAFPNNAAELPWPDMSFMMHAFPTLASFHAFASAAANFVTQVLVYGNSNAQVGSIPSNNITIP